MLIYYDYSIYKSLVFAYEDNKELDKRLARVTEKLFQTGKAIFPYSFMHIEEFSLDEMRQTYPDNWYQIIRIIKKYSNGHRYLDSGKIALNQLSQLLDDDFQGYSWLKNWPIYFADNPSNPAPSPKIYNPFQIDPIIDDILTPDEAVYLHPAMIKLAQSTIKKDGGAHPINNVLSKYAGMTRPEILQVELGNQLSGAILAPHKTAVVNEIVKFCKEKKASFQDVLNHLQQKPVPILHVQSGLLSSIAAQTDAQYKPNDHYDILHMATGMPATNVIVTDNAWKERAENMKLPSLMGTKVFTTKVSEKESLVNYLESCV